MHRVCLLLALLALPASAAVQNGTLTRPAELRSTPYTDGTLLKTLPQGTVVEVLKRSGGWYEVKAAGAQGWVRMWLLRFSAGAGAGAAARDGVEMIQSGRAGSTYGTATTGVRGLSEEELRNAQPDPQALQQVEQLAVAADDARSFARAASLEASKAP